MAAALPKAVTATIRPFDPSRFHGVAARTSLEPPSFLSSTSWHLPRVEEADGASSCRRLRPAPVRVARQLQEVAFPQSIAVAPEKPPTDSPCREAHPGRPSSFRRHGKPFLPEGLAVTASTRFPMTAGRESSLPPRGRDTHDEYTRRPFRRRSCARHHPLARERTPHCLARGSPATAAPTWAPLPHCGVWITRPTSPGTGYQPAARVAPRLVTIFVRSVTSLAGVTLRAARRMPHPPGPTSFTQETVPVISGGRS